MYHRDLREALGGKDKLAYPCSQVLPTDSLSYPYPLRPRRSQRFTKSMVICVLPQATCVHKKPSAFVSACPPSASPSGEAGGWVCG
jgi:hypothetical protein